MKKYIPYKIYLVLVLSILVLKQEVQAVGEASTYFEIFVPPNNDAVGRDVCLIVTAIFDNTSFTITDDDMDGDADDSVTGVLQSGQSYVMYIRDNGVNDDAPHRGESASKQDGDFFVVSSNNLILASQSTNSDWQHDWVPATNKSSKGKKFIIYSPPTTFSNRDLNVFAYDDNTEVTVKKISWAAQTSTGYTNVDIAQSEVVMQQNINVGEDIIFYHTGGRDLLEPGETYLVESNKDITAQYGALWKNARDGGGYVPSANGTSSGELFYFAVPYQSAREQEIRIVAWDDNTEVDLLKYNNGSWENIQSWSLNALETGDWVSYSGNVDATFKIVATAGKKVSVFEANWLETGSFGTSDIATMVSSHEGTTAGTQFLVYMAPPGNEGNVTDPFTGEKLGQYTHAFLFSRKNATVTVKDAYTNGQELSQTYNIEAGRYADFRLDANEWKSIYNGDGNPNSGPERPYVLIESDVAISVFNTNYNDNWMSYFGTSQEQDFTIVASNDNDNVVYAPNEELVVSTTINFDANQDVTNPNIEIVVQDGAEVVSSVLKEDSGSNEFDGDIVKNENTGITTIEFNNLPDLDADKTYTTETTLELNTNYNDGAEIPESSVISVETIISGDVGGVYQQATVSEGITNNTADQSQLLYRRLDDNSDLVTDLTNAWSVSVIDIDNDGDDDILFSEYTNDDKSRLYINDGTGAFERSYLLHDFLEKNIVVNAVTDYNNDGNLDVLSGTNLNRVNQLLRNNGNTSFSAIDGFFDDKGYTHGIAFADVNNDGFVDMFVSDYMPTRSNLLYINDEGLSYESDKRAGISQSNYSIGAVFADYDNDGDVDLFVPNDKHQANYLYKNNGAGNMELLDIAPFNAEMANSTGASWGDYDNDGDLDLFVANAGNQLNYLYENKGGDVFERILDEPFISDRGNSHGSVWVDMDNDGDLDLFVTNDKDQVNFLYLNNGDGTFAKEEQEIVCSKNGNPFATAVGDLNADGFLDIVVSTHSNEANQIFMNNGNSNHWLGVHLEGTNSNYQGLGAKVKVKSNGVWQVREVTSNTGGGANAQSSFTAHFGLGDATSVDSLVINWPSGYQQVYTNVVVDQVKQVIEEDGGLVTGLVFIDANANCILDEGEELLNHARIQIQHDGVTRYFYTNDEGEYNAYLTPASYTINLAAENWDPSCGDFIDQQVTISQLGQNFENYNIGVEAVQYLPDLKIDYSSTAFRKGFEKQSYISVYNVGTAEATQVNVSLELGSKVDALSSSPVWDSYSNQTLEWTIDALPVNADTMILINDRINLSSEIRDEITINASVSASEDELDYTNNATSYVDEVVGSVDPNDILVSPNGRVLPGTRLEYTIRFQNVGNYPASFVKVFNALPNHIVEGSFKMLSASHDYEMTEYEDGRKEWFFEDIDLPDSVSNEPESHGYIKYEVMVEEDIHQSVNIYNSADIVFDYNDALTTNTTITSVLYFSDNNRDKAIHVFPNPAREYTSVVIISEERMVPIANIEIIDASGKRVLSKRCEDLPESVDLELDLSAGVYFVRVKGADGASYVNFLSIK